MRYTTRHPHDIDAISKENEKKASCHPPSQDVGERHADDDIERGGERRGGGREDHTRVLT